MTSNSDNRFAFRGANGPRHRAAQARFKRAVWTNLIFAVVLAGLAAVTSSPVLWWFAVAALVLSVLCWLLARVPPKETARGPGSSFDEDA